MSWIDWVVLVGTIGFITLYGMWKTRGVRDAATFLRGGNTLRWPTIGLSIMATQASAITFLSTPGLAFEDGMRFVQFYFGLPLAMIVVAAVFVPIFYRLKVFTAYEYLEHRFDARVRYLGALLFLVQRGLAAGITIYAPAIILSSIMGWDLNATNLGIGLVVIAYTVLGGSAAVSQTQKQQMIVILAGMFIAGAVVVWRLPENVSFASGLKLAGALDRMNVVSFELDWNSRYNIWAGLLGGFFLQLSYFGTDQSQVARYLTGRSLTESRLGLVFNGLFKIPMQFLIMLIGILVFVFFLFAKPPMFFNTPTLARVEATAHAPELRALEARYDAAFEAQKAAAEAFVVAEGGEAASARARLRSAAAEVQTIRAETKALVKRAVPGAETKDADYVFLTFVLAYLPVGLVGLLVAVILMAAMSSTAAELNALGTTTTVDLYKRAFDRTASTGAERARHDLRASKWFTMLWGAVAVAFATFASLLDNLIEAVNILGSIFYGTVLGLFVVAFFLKRVTATPVLFGALVAQVTVVTLFTTTSLGFLWFNVIGCTVVVVVSLLLQAIGLGSKPGGSAETAAQRPS